MKINEVFDRHVMGNAVPLSITEVGMAYLNDNHVWNITINTKNSDCVENTITIAQLLSIFQTNCSCFRNQSEWFAKEQKEMITQLQQYDPQERVEFKK